MGGEEKGGISKEGGELGYGCLYERGGYVNMREWSVGDVKGDRKEWGVWGCGSKVKKIEKMMLEGKERKRVRGRDGDVEKLIVEVLGKDSMG